MHFIPGEPNKGGEKMSSVKRVIPRPQLTALDFLAPVSLALLLLAVWAVITATSNIPKFILPSPSSVFSTALSLYGSATFWPYLGNTLGGAVGGTLAGILFSVPMAFAIHHSRSLNAALQPFLGASQAIPAVALAPLLLIWLPTPALAVVLLCALMVFFPILVSTTVGLRHLNREVLEAARLDGGGTWQLLRYMEFPLVLPSLMGGIRNGITLSITGAVVGEMVIGGHGMGTLITLQSHNVDTAGMFVSLFTICTLAALIYLLIYRLERRSKALNVE